MEFIQALYIGLYAVLLVVPFCVAYYFRKRFTGILSLLSVIAISAILMSGIVIAQWLGYDWYLGYKIAPLDRDGDGIWSADEAATWPPEDHKNMDSYIGDGGRNVFAAIIFPLFSLVYSTAATLFYWLIAWLVSRR
ncbi:hypothetical protein NBRC116188_30360 [Oceaniserpentilla sp. 4NH20-0058]|uniref:hypothetical protein n=1 Tax=Oceaniserpentilla sp. 4NH20-0058 TaxID=3127660 RepID=UPI00310C05D9